MGADRSALTALGVIAVLLLALAATTSGGLAPIHAGTTTAHQVSRSGEPPADHGAARGGHDTGTTQPTPPMRPHLGLAWLPTWGQLVTVVVLAFFALAALAALTSLRVKVVRRRMLPQPRQRPATPPPGEEPEGAPATLRTLLGEQLSTLGTGTPRNAIVAAWVQLEEFAATHGIPRRAADTPAEFVVHALAAYRLDRTALERLADLYREARFSAHPMGEADRDDARACLVTLTRAGATS